MTGTLAIGGCTPWSEPQRVTPATPPAEEEPEPPRLPPIEVRGLVMQALSPDPGTAEVQLAVAEAAIRNLWAHNASAIQRDASRVCISLFDHDPDAAFLARLRDLGRPVRAASKFRKRRNDLELRVESIELVDDTHAEVDGGYYEASLSASGDHLWLERQGERWVVVARERSWIS